MTQMCGSLAAILETQMELLAFALVWPIYVWLGHLVMNQQMENQRSLELAIFFLLNNS